MNEDDNTLLNVESTSNFTLNKNEEKKKNIYKY